LKREPFVEGWEENQCFSLNSRPTAHDLPCDVRDYEVGFPNRYRRGNISNPDRDFDPGFFVLLSTFVILSEAKNGASGASDMDCQAAQGSGE